MIKMANFMLHIFATYASDSETKNVSTVWQLQRREGGQGVGVHGASTLPRLQVLALPVSLGSPGKQKLR